MLPENKGGPIDKRGLQDDFAFALVALAGRVLSIALRDVEVKAIVIGENTCK